MASDTVLILCATLGLTAAVITIIICVGCMYCSHLKWVKHPAIHPLRPENEYENTHSKRHKDMVNGEAKQIAKLHHDEYDDTSDKQTYLKTGNGEIIKPNLYINQDILTFYRSVCIRNTVTLISPPAKVQQLYREESMTDLEKEERQLFKTLRHQSKHTDKRKEPRKPARSSALTEKSSSKVAMPPTLILNVNGLPKSSSCPTDSRTKHSKPGRTESMVTIVSNIEDHLVRPVDIQLGEF